MSTSKVVVVVVVVVVLHVHTLLYQKVNSTPKHDTLLCCDGQQSGAPKVCWSLKKNRTSIRGGAVRSFRALEKPLPPLQSPMAGEGGRAKPLH